MIGALQAYKTALHIEGETDLFICSTIKHEDGFWIVPKWIAQPEKGVYQPERIIRIDQFGPTPTFGNPLHDFRLSATIPRSLISDLLQSSTPGLVELRPAIFLRGDPPAPPGWSVHQ